MLVAFKCSQGSINCIEYVWPIQFIEHDMLGQLVSEGWCPQTGIQMASLTRFSNQ